MHNPRISILAAVSENRVIGKDNKLPWRIKNDLIRVRSLIKGHVVILGRKSYDSMVWYYKKSGRELPGKLYIIVTRDTSYRPQMDKSVVVHAIDEAFQLAREKEESEIFIFGGEQLFRQTLDTVDMLHLTIVKGQFDGDAFFPDYSQFTKEVFREGHEDDGQQYAFVDLVRE